MGKPWQSASTLLLPARCQDGEPESLAEHCYPCPGGRAGHWLSEYPVVHSPRFLPLAVLIRKDYALTFGDFLLFSLSPTQILGITNPAGKKRYVAAAFPSACGKTNLAMMQPALPGWKVECVGDDIAWMRFDSEGEGAFS